MPKANYLTFVGFLAFVWPILIHAQNSVPTEPIEAEEVKIEHKMLEGAIIARYVQPDSRVEQGKVTITFSELGEFRITFICRLGDNRHETIGKGRLFIEKNSQKYKSQDSAVLKYLKPSLSRLEDGSVVLSFTDVQPGAQLTIYSSTGKRDHVRFSLKEGKGGEQCPVKMKWQG